MAWNYLNKAFQESQSQHTEDPNTIRINVPGMEQPDPPPSKQYFKRTWLESRGIFSLSTQIWEAKFNRYIKNLESQEIKHKQLFMKAEEKSAIDLAVQAAERDSVKSFIVQQGIMKRSPEEKMEKVHEYIDPRFGEPGKVTYLQP